MSDFDAGTDRAWYAKPGFIVAAVLLVVVIVGGVIAIAVNQLRPDEPSPSTSAPTSAPSSTSPSATPSDEPDEPDEPDASVCDLPAGGGDEPLDEAPVTEWDFVGVTGLPSSPDAGPGDVADSGLRTCFAFSPTGALMAAGNITAMGIAQAVSPEELEYFYAPGQTLPETSAWSESSVRLSIVGFSMTTYSAERTTVALALQTTTGEYVSYVLDLTWAEGDWKLLLAPDGSLLTPAVQIESLGGYVPWSAD